MLLDELVVDEDCAGVATEEDGVELDDVDDGVVPAGATFIGSETPILGFVEMGTPNKSSVATATFKPVSSIAVPFPINGELLAILRAARSSNWGLVSSWPLNIGSSFNALASPSSGFKGPPK